MEAVVFGLGQVAAQVSAAQVPRLWTDRMAFGVSDVRVEGGSRALPKCIWVPTHTLNQDAARPQAWEGPSPVLSSATQRKMQVATPGGFALCWLLARRGPTTAPWRESGISTASSRAPTTGPHPSGCFCFRAAIRLDGRSYSSTGFSLDLSAQCLIFQAKMTGFLAYVTPCGCLHSALEISWS